MQYKQDGDTYIVYVEQEEGIMETLTLFCKEKGFTMLNFLVLGL